MTFAMTFDGYEEFGSFEGSSTPANTALRRYKSSGHLPESLTQLRNCIFFEHRRWRHSGENSSPQAQEYIEALLEAIRAKVFAGSAVGVAIVFAIDGRTVAKRPSPEVAKRVG